jgi:hypothetical protein
MYLSLPAVDRVRNQKRIKHKELLFLFSWLSYNSKISSSCLLHIKMISKLLGLIFLVAGAAASSYPEVIPGPGLPSLAELGLRSADLFTTTPVVC